MLHSPNRTMPAPSRMVPTVVITATGLASSAMPHQGDEQQSGGDEADGHGESHRRQDCDASCLVLGRQIHSDDVQSHLDLATIEDCGSLIDPYRAGNRGEGEQDEQHDAGLHVSADGAGDLVGVGSGAEQLHEGRTRASEHSHHAHRTQRGHLGPGGAWILQNLTGGDELGRVPGLAQSVSEPHGQQFRPDDVGDLHDDGEEGDDEDVPADGASLASEETQNLPGEDDEQQHDATDDQSDPRDRRRLAAHPYSQR